MRSALALGLAMAMASPAWAQAQKPGASGRNAKSEPAKNEPVKPSRSEQTRVIPGGVGVWTESRGGAPARPEDQTPEERAAVAMESAEQLLMTVEFYKNEFGRWPETLKQAAERARLGALPVVLGLSGWELGPNGSVQSPVEDAVFCAALQNEGAQRDAAKVGAPAGCAPSMDGSGRLMFVMAQLPAAS